MFYLEVPNEPIYLKQTLPLKRYFLKIFRPKRVCGIQMELPIQNLSADFITTRKGKWSNFYIDNKQSAVTCNLKSLSETFGTSRTKPGVTSVNAEANAHSAD